MKRESDPMTKQRFTFDLPVNLAAIGSLIQLVVALSVLFLTAIILCSASSDATSVCSNVAYLQLNAGILGYILLVVNIAAAVGILSCRTAKKYGLLRLRSLIAVLAGAITIYSSWLFGIYFIPGTLVLVVAFLLMLLPTNQISPVS